MPVSIDPGDPRWWGVSPSLTPDEARELMGMGPGDIETERSRTSPESLRDVTTVRMPGLTPLPRTDTVRVENHRRETLYEGPGSLDVTGDPVHPFVTITVRAGQFSRNIALQSWLVEGATVTVDLVHDAPGIHQSPGEVVLGSIEPARITLTLGEGAPEAAVDYLHTECARVPVQAQIAEAAEIEARILMDGEVYTVADIEGFTESMARVVGAARAAAEGIRAFRDGLARVGGPALRQASEGIRAFRDAFPESVRREYEDLIRSTRAEFLDDPHNYGHPTTNAMHWSPPEDSQDEEVPRWLA